MPIIDLHLPEGTFDAPIVQQVLGRLSKAILVCELTRDNPAAERLNWCYLHEYPPGHSLMGGRVEDRPHYRVQVSTLHGAMTTENKQAVVTAMTEILLAAEGSPVNQLNAGRVWVLFNELPDGNWGGGGRLYTLEQLSAYVAGATDQ